MYIVHKNRSIGRYVFVRAHTRVSYGKTVCVPAHFRSYPNSIK